MCFIRATTGVPLLTSTVRLLPSESIHFPAKTSTSTELVLLGRFSGFSGFSGSVFQVEAVRGPAALFQVGCSASFFQADAVRGPAALCQICSGQRDAVRGPATLFQVGCSAPLFQVVCSASVFIAGLSATRFQVSGFPSRTGAFCGAMALRCQRRESRMQDEVDDREPQT